MKILITCFGLAFAVSAFGADTEKSAGTVDGKIAELTKQLENTPKQKITREEIENRPQVLEKTGGFVDVPAVGTAIIVIDGREKPTGSCDQFAEVFVNYSKMNVCVDKTPIAADETALSVATKKLLKMNAMYAMVVTDDSNAPGVAIFPEERIAIINASKYQEGKDPVRREERIHKELWRSLGFISGIGYAPFKNDVLQPVYSVPELDALEWHVMQPMHFQKMYAGMASRGIKRARHIPYRLAVMEGWAAAPTNQYQKAVWDEVHKLPTEPIKIKPETKKVQD